MLSFLILDANKNVTSWISTRKGSGKVQLFGTNLEPTMPNLTNGSLILKLTTLF